MKLFRDLPLCLLFRPKHAISEDQYSFFPFRQRFIKNFIQPFQTFPEIHGFCDISVTAFQNIQKCDLIPFLIGANGLIKRNFPAAFISGTKEHDYQLC